MRPARAFTLIELLIVVGIIAILAAIAVPNFLEAQTRSKVSRARTDLRTIATGVEMYAVDQNHYPPTATLEALTSPVAYQTTNFPDVFATVGASSYKPMGFVNAVTMSDPAELSAWGVSSSTPDQRAALAQYRWFIYSSGPDLHSTTLDNTQKAFNDVVNAPGADFGLFYDPTNGTISTGDVIRSAKWAK